MPTFPRRLPEVRSLPLGHSPPPHPLLVLVPLHFPLFPLFPSTDECGSPSNMCTPAAGSKYERNMPAPMFTPPPKEMIEML